MSDIRSLYRMYIHPILSVGIPFFFIVSLVLMLKDAFVFDASFPFLLLGFVLIVGIEEAGIGNALIQERAASFVRFREIILIVIACFLITSLVPGKDQGELWGVRMFVYTLLAVFQWSLSFVVQNNFRRREVFLGIIRRKEGKQLKESLRNAGGFAAEINMSLAFNRAAFTTFIISDFVLLMLIFAMGMSLHGYTVFAVAVSISLSIAGIASVNMFINDLYIYSAGINIRPFFQQRRIIGSIVWLIFIVIAAAFLASNKSLLPPSILIDFLNWLRGLLPKPRNIDPRLIPPPDPIQSPNWASRFSQLRGNEGGLDFTWLLILMERLILISILLGIAFFLIAPLLRGEGRAFFKRYNPIRVFIQVVIKLSYYLKYFWLQLLNGFKKPAFLVSGNKVKKDKYGFSIPKDRAGILKRIERSAVIRWYLRLISWGKRKGSPWRGHGPAEYAQRLAEKFPGLETDFVLVASVFEETVFSQHLVGEKRISEYRDAVKRILKT